MATRGRKPKPTAQKRLTGNPGRRPLNEAEPKLEAKIPSCPRHLDTVAKKEWRRVAAALKEKGLITEVDRAVLTGYCEAWSQYVAASKAVQQYGPVLISAKKTTTDRKTGETTVTGGVPYASPYYNQMMAAAKSMKEFAAELGMTPSSRGRVQVAGGADGGDPLLELLTKRYAPKN